LNPPRSLSSLDRYRRRSCTDRFSSQRHSHRRRRRTRTAHCAPILTLVWQPAPWPAARPFAFGRRLAKRRL